MKTIYKQPIKTLPNEVEGVRKLNSTGSLRIVEGYRYDLIVSYDTPIAYVADWKEGHFMHANQTKVILCNEFYSMTTRKHQKKIKDLYSGFFGYSIGEFELGGFLKRAEIDGVDVRGGWNGGTNTNRLHA